MESIRVCVAGVTGWTGSAVAEAVGAATISSSSPACRAPTRRSFSSVGEALDAVPVDVLVDYTRAAVVKGNVLAAIERGVGVVIGSSGLTAADFEEVDARLGSGASASIAAGNFSLTAALLLRFAARGGART